MVAENLKKHFKGTESSDSADSQLDNIAEIVEEMWEKLEMFEEKKRSNLIFYGVRGEMRETQNDLINKVGLLYVALWYDWFRSPQSSDVLSTSRRM